MSFIVVYKNNPRFKGLDEYVSFLAITDLETTPKFVESRLFTKEEAEEFVKFYPTLDDGHLEATILPLS